MNCLEQKHAFQTTQIQCALSSDRSKGTDQIHLIQYCRMYTLCTEICDLFPGWR